MSILKFRQVIRLAIVVALFLGGAMNTMAVSANDESTSLSQLDVKTERVFVFKDGYCLVIKRATATTDDDGVVYTDEVPDAAVLGSFWAVPEKATMKSMVAGWVETESEKTNEINCVSVLEILKANIGKACSFKIGNEQLRGSIVKILGNDKLGDESESEVDMQHLLSSRQPYSSMLASHTSVSSVTGTHFLLRTDSGDIMVAVASISHLTIKDMNSTREQVVKKKTSHKRLTMHFAKPNSKVDISIMYFRPDVRWIPTYRIDLTDKKFVDAKKKGDKDGEVLKTAEIVMQGELLNEAEDFIDVPIHLVVGVPNFRFRSTPSPMVLEASLRNTLVQAAPAIMGGNNRFLNNSQQLSNAMYAQRSGEQGGMGQGDGGMVELPDDFSTQAGNDLFVYEVDNLSIKKGERATVQILRTEAAYRDIYTWDVSVEHSESYAASSADANSPLVLSENKVWRQVELINRTDVPWTTGAVMFVDGFQPVAQELLAYTSPGGTCRVPVTISVDMKGKVSDRETDRELDAVAWRRNKYARVKGKTEIELANNKFEPVNVEIRLRFGGKAKTVSDDGTFRLESYRAEDWVNRQGDAINNSSEVVWKSRVKPGECFKPSVDYEFLLRY